MLFSSDISRQLIVRGHCQSHPSVGMDLSLGEVPTSPTMSMKEQQKLLLLSGGWTSPARLKTWCRQPGRRQTALFICEFVEKSEEETEKRGHSLAVTLRSAGRTHRSLSMGLPFSFSTAPHFAQTYFWAVPHEDQYSCSHHG